MSQSNLPEVESGILNQGHLISRKLLYDDTPKDVIEIYSIISEQSMKFDKDTPSFWVRSIIEDDSLCIGPRIDIEDLVIGTVLHREGEEYHGPDLFTYNGEAENKKRFKTEKGDGKGHYVISGCRYKKRYHLENVSGTDEKRLRCLNDSPIKRENNAQTEIYGARDEDISKSKLEKDIYNISMQEAEKMSLSNLNKPELKIVDNTQYSSD